MYLPARAVLPPGHLQRVPAPRETAFASCCGAASFSLGGACARWSLQRATVLSRARCFLLYATAALHRAQFPVVPRCLVTPVQPKVRHGRPRSKSPCRARARSGTGREAADGIVALPSLRPGAPERLPRRRGQLPDLSTDHLRTRALSELVSNVYAASSRLALLSRLRTAQHILASWGDQLLPPTAPKVMQLCAGLRSVGYRSAEAYVSAYRVFAERSGFTFGPSEARAARDGLRACSRGIGPPVKALSLPFDRLGEASRKSPPLGVGRPDRPSQCDCRRCLGGWPGRWNFRRHARHSSLCGLVRSRLSSGGFPLPRRTPRHSGSPGSHGCLCRPTAPEARCPAHAVWDQLILLRRHFGDRWTPTGTRTAPPALSRL